jgi:CRP/FNR family cyclic AMP-dependent transcriptional regulator
LNRDRISGTVDPEEPQAAPKLIREPADVLLPEAGEAWRCSLFGGLPDALQDRLLADVQEYELPAGEVLQPEAADSRRRLSAPPCALVVSGLLRTYVMSGTRQVTLRYLGPGMVVGIPGAISSVAAVDAQAITDSRILALSAARLARLARTEPELAWELARFLSDCVYECVEILSGNVFLPVRCRVARHLLDLAAREDSQVVVRASTQDIADATGTVREVVGRAMRELREEGLVARDGELLVLRDLGALHSLSHEPRAKPVADSSTN